VRAKWHGDEQWYDAVIVTADSDSSSCTVRFNEDGILQQTDTASLVLRAGMHRRERGLGEGENVRGEGTGEQDKLGESVGTDKQGAPLGTLPLIYSCGISADDGGAVLRDESGSLLKGITLENMVLKFDEGSTDEELVESWIAASMGGVAGPIISRVIGYYEQRVAEWKQQESAKRAKSWLRLTSLVGIAPPVLLAAHSLRATALTTMADAHTLHAHGDSGVGGIQAATAGVTRWGGGLLPRGRAGERVWRGGYGGEGGRGRREGEGQQRWRGFMAAELVRGLDKQGWLLPVQTPAEADGVKRQLQRLKNEDLCFDSNGSSSGSTSGATWYRTEDEGGVWSGSKSKAGIKREGEHKDAKDDEDDKDAKGAQDQIKVVVLLVGRMMASTNVRLNNNGSGGSGSGRKEQVMVVPAAVSTQPPRWLYQRFSRVAALLSLMPGVVVLLCTTERDAGTLQTLEKVADAVAYTRKELVLRQPRKHEGGVDGGGGGDDGDGDYGGIFTRGRCLLSRHPLGTRQLLEIMQARGALLALTIPVLGAQLAVAAELPFIGVVDGLEALELAETTGLQQFFFLPKRYTLTEAQLLAGVHTLLPQVRGLHALKTTSTTTDGFEPTAMLVLEDPPSLEWVAVVQKCSLVVRRAWRQHMEAMELLVDRMFVQRKETIHRHHHHPHYQDQ
jgi:hypothetical protein